MENWPMCSLATSSNIRGTSLLKRRQLRGCRMSLHGAPSLSRPNSPRAISSSSQRHPAVSVLPRSKLQKLWARQSSQPPRTRAKRQALIDHGADHVVVTDEEDVVARVMEITRGV